MRKEKETTQELKNRLIDPNDDKFAADRVVRNNSIDPGMLALDSIAPMWYPNFFIEPNFDGDEDKIRVYAGTLVVTNYNTLDRYNIAKDRANYNPTRSWTVAQTDITLPTKDAYYLWAKIDLTDGSTACVIEAHTQHIEMKRYIENNFLMIRMNPISVGEEAL
jgi:hypothetical protein